MPPKGRRGRGLHGVDEQGAGGDAPADGQGPLGLASLEIIRSLDVDVDVDVPGHGPVTDLSYVDKQRAALLSWKARAGAEGKSDMASGAGAARGGARRPLRVQIRDLLERRILSGQYAPRDKLVEYRIARELGVSQAPVGKALRELENMRLVEIREHVGTRIRGIEPYEHESVGRVRVTLEAEAAKLTARQLPHRPEELAALRDHLSRMRRAAAEEDNLTVAVASVAFHRAVVAAAAEPVLLDVWNALGVELRTAAAVRGGRMSLAETADSHQPILAALRAGDARAASWLAREHGRTWVTHHDPHRARPT